MFRPRTIPVLLLKNGGLVKSKKFKQHRYIGDPINAVKIFNDQKADELVFLDIDATKENRLISLDFINQVGDEANMPFAVGGGIKKIKDIQLILENGAEKVVINSAVFENKKFVKDASKTFGSSTIAVCLDIKNNFFYEQNAYYCNAKIKVKGKLLDLVKEIEQLGVGEIIIQSVDRDGTYEGYDIDLIKNISESVSIPVVALGGAKDYKDFFKVVNKGYASAVAAGSLFVYHGSNRGILINFPSESELKDIYK